MRSSAPRPTTRCAWLLIHGKPDVFTAGNDIEDFAKTARRSARTRLCFRFLDAASRAQKPLVAAVNGARGRHRDDAAPALRPSSMPATTRAFFPASPSRVWGWCRNSRRATSCPSPPDTSRAAELLLLGEPFGPRRSRLAAGFRDARGARGGRRSTAAMEAARKARGIAREVGCARRRRSLKGRARPRRSATSSSSRAGIFREMLGRARGAAEALAAFIEKTQARLHQARLDRPARRV